jgi:hypothetical protein
MAPTFRLETEYASTAIEDLEQGKNASATSPFNLTSIAIPQIVDFNPKSGFIYGSSRIALKLANFPNFTICEDLVSDFKSHGKSSCLSLGFVAENGSQNYANCCHIAVFRTPRALYTGSLLPSLTLTGANSSISFNFPSNFTYLEPPLPIIYNVTPSVASISKAIGILVSISDFPSVSVLSDIIVKFTWPSTNKTTIAVVNGFTADQQASPNNIQINTSNPTGTRSKAEPAILTVYHAYYPQYKAVFVGFVFDDSSRPKITKLQSAGAASSLATLRIGMSIPQSIFVSIEDVPANFEDIECTAQVEGERINVASSTYNSVTMSATIVLSLGQRMTVGIKRGLLIFGRSIMPSGCLSSCCDDDSCSAETACGNFKSACFQLEVFDDTLPFIINQPKSAG